MFRLLVLFTIFYIVSSFKTFKSTQLGGFDDAFCYSSTMATKFKLQAKGFGVNTNSGSGDILSNLKITKTSEHQALRGGIYGKLLATQLESFAAIKDDGIPCANDLYARLCTSNIFWFIGKLNHRTEITSNEALSLLYPLFIEYSKTLRPLELSGPQALAAETSSGIGSDSSGDNGGVIEIWTAPGNSEMDTAQHKNILTKVNAISGQNKNSGDEDDGSGGSNELNTKLNQLMVNTGKAILGFEPEIYQGGEDGFRVKRDNDGKPTVAPIEVQVKSPEEIDKEGTAEAGYKDFKRIN